MFSSVFIAVFLVARLGFIESWPILNTESPMKKNLFLALAFALAATFAIAQETSTPKDPSQQRDPAAQPSPTTRATLPRRIRPVRSRPTQNPAARKLRRLRRKPRLAITP